MILEKQILPSESFFIQRTHFTYKGQISSYPSIHYSPQMPPLPSLTRLPHNKPFSPLWELFPTPSSCLPPGFPSLGWFARSWGIVCRCAWRKARPPCPGRTCGPAVFTLAPSQVVSHTACWGPSTLSLPLTDDNVQPSSHFIRVEVAPAILLILACWHSGATPVQAKYNRK